MHHWNIITSSRNLNGRTLPVKVRLHLQSLRWATRNATTMPMIMNTATPPPISHQLTTGISGSGTGAGAGVVIGVGVGVSTGAGVGVGDDVSVGVGVGVGAGVALTTNVPDRPPTATE